MIIWLTKVLHMAAISIWVGGLIAIPAFFVRRTGLADGPLERLHRTTRFLHVTIVSPAAYVAIATGIALVFLRETWVPWFSIKLLFVGLLAVVHIGTGMLLVSTFEPDGRHNALASALIRTGCLLATAGILWAVLAKPVLDFEDLTGPALAPGGLGEWIGETVDPLIDAATP